MDDFNALPPPVRNPITHEKHRREVFWQITLPLTVGILCVLLLAMLAIFGASAVQAGKLADISLIWLIVPTIFFSLIFLVILAGFVYAITRLLQALPLFAVQTHDVIFLFGLKVKQVGDAVVGPILKVHSFMARLEYLGGRLKRKKDDQG